VNRYASLLARLMPLLTAACGGSSAPTETVCYTPGQPSNQVGELAPVLPCLPKEKASRYLMGKNCVHTVDEGPKSANGPTCCYDVTETAGCVVGRELRVDDDRRTASLVPSRLWA
jgi:hypothetical protein